MERQMTIDNPPRDYFVCAVVEDDDLLNRLISDRLRKAGYEVESYRDGVTALGHLRDREDVLILLDYVLPDMDGSEFIRRFPEIPDYLIITGFGDIALAVDMMKNGALDFIVKDPSFLDLLPSRVERVLETLRNRRKLQLMTENLRISEAHYRLLVDNAHEGIAVVQGERFVFFNERALQVMRCDAQTMKTLNPFEVLLEEDRQMMFDRNRQRLQGEHPPADAEVRIFDREGNMHWANLHSVLIQWDGRPAVLLFYQDITDRRILESQLRQAARMDAIGQLAGGVAQDFDRLLTRVLARAHAIRFTATENPTIAQDANDIVKTAERMAALTQQLLGMARKDRTDFKKSTLHSIAEETVSAMSSTLPETIKIEQTRATDTDMISGRASEIGQVVQQLLANAVEAMNNQGNIVLSIDRVSLDEHYIRNHPGAEAGDYILLSITDSGPGVPIEERQRIFEPFFTTRKERGASGLGLSMVYGIIKNHGGLVELYSETGYGSTFKIYLPALESRKDQSDEQISVPGGARILIVDDDHYVRLSSTRVLQRQGHDVVTASSGMLALDYFTSHWRNVDLVLLDLVMPGMDGIQTFREMKRINPNVRAVLCTGFTVNDRILRSLDEGIVACLNKPLRSSQLARIVRDILNLDDDEESEKGKGSSPESN